VTMTHGCIILKVFIRKNYCKMWKSANSCYCWLWMARLVSEAYFWTYCIKLYLGWFLS